MLERVGSDARDAESEEAEQGEDKQVEQDERLDVFRDFIEQLDIDDLGKASPSVSASRCPGQRLALVAL